jgi:aminoglycoside phosphotransferase (APT) family kinase protein
MVPGPARPRRDRPIASVDFAALRRRQPRPLLVEAEERVAGLGSGQADAFVHGDLWQGNALWRGDTLAGLVDWDCAGAGPPGVDLGSLRCDAAVCFGMEAADDVRRGWEEEAGRPAADLARWDVVAALSTPPDMGWFVDAIAGQGRDDLTRDVLVRRRDAFLRDALDRLDAERG